MIEVYEYDPKWPEMFEEEARRVREALGCNCVEVHHIGSTAVPGLRAKPIIDMLPVVRNIQEVDKETGAMEALGYNAKGEYGIAFRRYFQKGKNRRTHNVHVFQEDDPEIDRYLKFRNWMRSHQDDAENYGKLKAELANKFPEDIHQYTNGKNGFVAEIDGKDGFAGWRMVKAQSEREWDAVRRYRLKHFLKSETFTHQDQVHFVFYKESEIIGYAHLQLLTEKRATLRIMVVDEPYHKMGYETQFLRLCERWLYHQGFRMLVDGEVEKLLSGDPMDRPKVSVYIAMSIDGYIARKDESLDWLDRVGGFDEDYGFQKLMVSIDGLIIGRKTYEVATTVADPYPEKRVVVLSNSLNEVRKDMELYRGDLAALLTRLHKEGIKHIWVDGGITVSQFLSCQMVDTMTLSIIPIILGSGIPLFNVVGKEIPCRLISSKAYPSGLAQLNYQIEKL